MTAPALQQPLTRAVCSVVHVVAGSTHRCVLLSHGAETKHTSSKGVQW